jgi:hypothetical protein
MRLLLVVLCDWAMAAQQASDWQTHLDWSIRDQGHVDCGEQYSPYPTCAVCTPGWKGHPDCLERGGRACMMSYATRDARAGRCNLPLEECWLHNVITAPHVAPSKPPHQPVFADTYDTRPRRALSRRSRRLAIRRLPSMRTESRSNKNRFCSDL